MTCDFPTGYTTYMSNLIYIALMFAAIIVVGVGVTAIYDYFFGQYE